MILIDVDAHVRLVKTHDVGHAESLFLLGSSEIGNRFVFPVKEDGNVVEHLGD